MLYLWMTEPGLELCPFLLLPWVAVLFMDSWIAKGEIQHWDLWKGRAGLWHCLNSRITLELSPWCPPGCWAWQALPVSLTGLLLSNICHPPPPLGSSLCSILHIVPFFILYTLKTRIFCWFYFLCPWYTYNCCLLVSERNIVWSITSN